MGNYRNLFFVFFKVQQSKYQEQIMFIFIIYHYSIIEIPYLIFCNIESSTEKYVVYYFKRNDRCPSSSSSLKHLLQFWNIEPAFKFVVLLTSISFSSSRFQVRFVYFRSFFKFKFCSFCDYEKQGVARIKK